MTSGTLYIMPRSPRSNWLGALVKALNLDIDVVDSATQPEQFAKEFPLKKTPAFIDSEGFELTELIAIIEYLVSISDNKTVGGENAKDKAQVLRWLSFMNSDIANAWAQVAYIAQTDEAKQAAGEVLKKLVEYIESELSKRSFLATNYITVADEYLVICFEAFLANIGGGDEKTYPNLFKWYAEMKEQDPVAKIILSN
ncbi:hypothetical protein C6P40_000319 [Pichia californica]|uniref:Uncharacterized protein n=1 Tax=Pichia californica TaxID=460514 RepID=A0A9P7BGM9_9ASCO|nr:hypothetical protein C6P42_005074 [[Candida] californica]KAG0688954.1 hypothetical protein C6P40_000319 [[Candida] californica]